MTVEDVDSSVLEAVDAAYRSKYGHYASIVRQLVEPEHRVNTLRPSGDRRLLRLEPPSASTPAGTNRVPI